MNLFLTQPEDYRYIYTEIFTEYQANPQLFANTFFDLISEIDPKVVRLIGYQLYTIGVDFGGLYKARGSVQKPKFLFDLANFSFESMIILLKYGFPQVIDDDLFFLTSIDLIDLGFYLDLFQNIGLNINMINRTTGGSLLHYFVEACQLSKVELLLCHRAVSTLIDKNGQSPLRIAIDLMDQGNYRDYLQIIRQLARYQARPRDIDRQIIESNPYRIKINHAIQAGATMTPYYCKNLRTYLSLDQVEDLSLITMVNPTLIDDDNFKEMVQGTNFELLAKGVEDSRDNSIQVGKIIVSWPYFIDTSKKTVYTDLLDNEIIAESPPPARKVYELALRNLHDNKGHRSTHVLSPPVPPIRKFEQWSSDTYYVPPRTGSTFPLPERALTPTGTPSLPSL